MYRITAHCLLEMERRGITGKQVQRVLQQPDQVVPGYDGAKIYQVMIRRGFKKHLFRVVVDDSVKPMSVITVYETSKIKKYWEA